MAPEQVRGAETSGSTGGHLRRSASSSWELLTGRRLFDGDCEADTLNRVLRAPIPRVRSLAPEVPGAMPGRGGRQGFAARADEKVLRVRLEFAEALKSAAYVTGMMGIHDDVIACVERVLGLDIVVPTEAPATVAPPPPPASPP